MGQVDCDVFDVVEGFSVGGVLCVRAQVDLDLLTASRARAQLDEICETGRVSCLVVELGADCFVDVRGLRALLESSRLQRSRGGTMVLVSTSRTVGRILQLLRLDEELPTVRTVADACREASSSPAR